MHGVLIVDKPAGPTSHDVVAVARRALSISKIGHTGTLDPLATGVLPLVVGRATRLASLLTGAEKEYVARVRFGESTATYDSERVPGVAGDQSAREDRGPGGQSARKQLPTGSEIEAALPEFRGTYLQMPPPFSAKKIAGTPAYKLARQQKPVELKPVDVTVKELELREYADGVAELRIVCSSGFYVRSLAHDLGQRLGCGAHLDGLRRTRAGAFGDADAVSLDTIVKEGPLTVARLVPMERLLSELPSVILSEDGVRRASHGNAIGPQDLESPLQGTSRIRLLDRQGGLLGIAEPVDGGLLHPLIVLV
jgi:tRNA pseudouridine55 synthase